MNGTLAVGSLHALGTKSMYQQRTVPHCSSAIFLSFLFWIIFHVGNSPPWSSERIYRAQFNAASSSRARALHCWKNEIIFREWSLGCSFRATLSCQLMRSSQTLANTNTLMLTFHSARFFSPSLFGMRYMTCASELALCQHRYHVARIPSGTH